MLSFSGGDTKIQGRENDDDRWGTSILAARTRASYERPLNPYVSLARFGKLPGVRRVSPGHYSVTGSAREVFAATETFSHYNKPVTITAP
jgi:hypothetical protein